jgi:hypothetical protein
MRFGACYTRSRLALSESRYRVASYVKAQPIVASQNAAATMSCQGMILHTDILLVCTFGLSRCKGEFQVSYLSERMRLIIPFLL